MNHNPTIEQEPSDTCVFCGKPIGDESPVFIAGSPLHHTCAAEYEEEMYAGQMRSEARDAEAEVFQCQYDDDPSPYDGTYSEE